MEPVVAGASTNSLLLEEGEKLGSVVRLARPFVLELGLSLAAPTEREALLLPEIEGELLLLEPTDADAVLPTAVEGELLIGLFPEVLGAAPPEIEVEVPMAREAVVVELGEAEDPVVGTTTGFLDVETDAEGDVVTLEERVQTDTGLNASCVQVYPPSI